MSRNQPWARARPGSREERRTLQPRTRILIVCEGAKTEPNYFRQFPVADVYDVAIVGAGDNTDRLVERAIALRNEAERAERPFNEIWCVFDRDSFTAHSFNRARQIAQNNRIRTAVSHECFELWYLLHFNFHDAGIPRRTYAERLGESLGEPYRKNMQNMYALLLSRQETAIRNARTLLGRYVPWNPERNNPSTNVHLLVERLNALAD